MGSPPLAQCRRRWPTYAATIVIGLAAAPAAWAHSVLIETEPARAMIVDEAPERVLLRFDEAVETSLGSIRVFDGNGRRVDAETITRPAPEEVAVAIEGELGRGTYTVAWRAISADSDPISGAFVFHVQAPGAAPTGIAAQVLEETPLVVSAFYTGGRFFEFTFLLLCVGGVAALVFALGPATPALRAKLLGRLALLGLALALTALLAIVFQGAAAGGFGLIEAFRWDIVSSVLDTRYGETALVRAAIGASLALTALTLRAGLLRRSEPLLGLAALLALGLAMTPSFSGHASVAGPWALVADVTHVVAAAAWTGGLAFVVLALVFARGERWPLAAQVVPRFSTLAVGSVVVLLVAGTANGYLQVRTWRGLWETEYGILLLAKVALVLPLLALGAYNNRYAVPRLRKQIASRLERRRFLRAAAAELAIMVGIVAVTAALVNAPPARTEIQMHGPAQRALDLGDLEVHLMVDPARAGANEITVTIDEHSGSEEIQEVRLAATLVSKGIGPILATARERGDTWVSSDVNLPIAGRWQLRVEIRMGEFELLTEKTSIEIREER